MADAVVVAALAVAIAMLVVIVAFLRYMFRRKRATPPAANEPDH